MPKSSLKKKGCLPAIAIGVLLLVAFAFYIDWWSRTPDGIAAQQRSVEREAEELEALAKQREREEAQARAEAEQAGLGQAYSILNDDGVMRDWRAADHLNKTEVVYRLSEQMIMRGNVPRGRASVVDLYACLDEAYAPAVAATPVREIASACAVSMSWVR